jgi:lipopolysaccharide assembly outer membrane protein LptD (OstA)
MELDLMGFSGIDSWGTWSIWRFGVYNSFITEVDHEKRNLLSWNVFVDYNAKNPMSPNKFSNLYSLISFQPTNNLRFFMESQTPTISGGDDFSQYNIGVSYQPCAAVETRLSYRSVKNHPIQRDREQITMNANVRVNEKYTVAGRWTFDINRDLMPIQQYSIYRKSGLWYTGANVYFRDNGGKKETGFGISISLGDIGTSLPES